MGKVLIRTDMGGTHGLGHASRMRALAQALGARGAAVHFVTTTAALTAFVAPFPVTVITADGVFCSLAESPWGNEAFTFVIDTKAPAVQDAGQLIRFRRYGVDGNRIVRIDHPQAMPATCDLLVLPGAHHAPKTLARIQYDFSHDLLAGWKYVMLEEEVTSRPPLPYAERGDPPQEEDDETLLTPPLVFCAGGSDPLQCLDTLYHWTRDLLPHVAKGYLVGRHSTGVVAAQLGHAASVFAGYGAWIVPFHRQTLRTAALVVGFFGQITYECLWYHTPMLCFARQELDLESVAQIARHTQGAVTSAGRFEECTASRFRHAVEDLWEAVHSPSPPLAPARDLLDGLGLHRVAEAILTLMAGK
jgi:hypothetical protein